MTLLPRGMPMPMPITMPTPMQMLMPMPMPMPMQMHTHTHTPNRARQLCVLLVAISLSLASGCRFDDDFANTTYRCAQSGECPDGQSCQAGVCRADDIVDPPGPGEACGTMAAGIEDFESVDLDLVDWRRWTVWSDVPEHMSVVDGQLVIAMPADALDVSAGFGTQAIFPLEGADASIEIVDLAIDDTLGMELELHSDGGTHASVYQEAGTLYMHYHPPDGSMDVASLPFDPAIHRVWRIRHADGALRWETSADGVTFVEHASRADVSDLGPWVGSQVSVWKGAIGEADVTITFDDLNATQEAVAFCPSDSLVEDFAEPTMGPAWELSDSGVCALHQEGGRLGFEFPDAGSATCIQRSATLFDLSTSTITVEAPLMDVAGMEQCLKIRLSGSQEVEFELFDGELRGEKSLDSGSSTVFSLQFDPASHRYWRLRGEGDAVFWEISADGLDWQVMGSHQSPGFQAELANARITFEGDTNTGMVENIGQSFDNLNLSP